jgi:hypothetical protein
MFLESLVKAALSAAVVGVLTAMLRHAGPRAGGLAAAVPINSMPALFWLSVEHGGGYATMAALGSLWGTGLTLLLGGSLLRLAAGRRGPARPTRRADARSATLTVTAAGAMSLLVSELSRHGGPQVCGLVAATPVIGMCALYAGYRQGGAPALFGVLGGYLDGMLAKAVFLGTLGFAWAAGAGAWAWPLALAAAAAALLVQLTWRNGPSLTRLLGQGYSRRPPCH